MAETIISVAFIRITDSEPH